MPNLFDYIAWRGDLTFDEAPLCEVDALAFSLLAYVDFDEVLALPAPVEGAPEMNVLSEGMAAESPKKTLAALSAAYFLLHPDDPPRPLGLIVPGDIVDLFRAMAASCRFGTLPLSGYVNEISESREMQFSAITLHLPHGNRFVAFRGTDDTVVGWREDFNLSFMDETPSQRKAAEYLSGIVLPRGGRLYVAGHSKGGNLAVWGAVHASARVRRRIGGVWSCDGPGHTAAMLESEAYRSLAPRIYRILPDSSLVGLLLEHDGAYSPIRSVRRGILQHDGLTWEVKGGAFVRSEGLSRRGQHADTVVRERIDSMSPEEKETFTRLLFTLLESTGAKTLTELYRGHIRTTLTMLRTYTAFTSEERETARYLLGKLFGLTKAEKTPAKPEPQPKPTPLYRPKSTTIHIEWRIPWRA